MEYYVIEPGNSFISGEQITIRGELYKHLAVVLRKKISDKLELTDGKGNIYTCQITKIDRSSVQCVVLIKKYGLYEPEISIRLFMSPLRNRDRFEFAVEKSVEIGVMEIVPVITKYTVLKDKFSEARYNRLMKIIKSAAGQSQRCILPVLNKVVYFSEMTELTKNSELKIVMYEQSEKEENKHLKIQNNKVDLLIGPEGGFDADEIKILVEQGWIKRSLGKRKLRAETAVIVSLFEILNY
ncbi:MAG: 16S rRNA (uracil(1498)-N(3))-methyltransferase [Ignavibacteria bacterium]|nr:16S rRNA (uracil(1498)-N(3))-methyltransferase [Ignavibacteria bacterium]